MLLDRPTKTLIAIFTLMISTFLVINHVIQSDPVEKWLLAGILFGISLIFWAWLWQESLPQPTGLALRDNSVAAVPVRHDWVISKEPVATVPAPTEILAPHDRAVVEGTADGVVALEASGGVLLDTLEVNKAKTTAEIISAMDDDDDMGVTAEYYDPPDNDDVPSGDDLSSDTDSRAEVIQAVATEQVDSMLDAPIVEAAKSGDHPLAEHAVGEAMAAGDGGMTNEDAIANKAIIEEQIAGTPIERSDQEINETPFAPESSTSGDDLEIVEGIGPKYAAALRAIGITTFAQLSATSTATLESAVTGTALRRPSNIDTWAEQAEYLARDDQAAFDNLVQKLKSGRRAE